MSENNQDIYVFLNKSSREAINDFIKYYLENSDSITNSCDDENFNTNFKIYEYESYVRDHNASINVIKPQFSFLFPRYYLTVMIDLTASMFTTTNDGDVKIEKALDSLKEFFYSAAKSYSFSNGIYDYNPEVIVNVICFNNNKITVIVKGWDLRVKSNFQEFCKFVYKEIYNEMFQERATSSDGTFFSILREGIISLNLLEDDKKSMKHLLIVSDYQYPITDGMCLDRCLSLLRHCQICCSFIHVKTTPDSLLQSNITDQGHDDQLCFIANATGGFYKTTKELSSNSDRYILRYRYFDQSDYLDIDSLSVKNFTDRTFNMTPSNVLFTIINMGCFLNSVNNLRDSRVEIELILPWRSEVYFKIVVVSKLPLEQQRKFSFSLSIFGQNYTLNEVYKHLSQDSNSIDQCLFRCFRGQILKEIKHSLNNINFFSQFNVKPFYLIPNFIINGLKPMLSPTNQPCDRIDKQSKPFFDFWKKTLDFTYLNCFHTTKINILLEHDYPFPEYLSCPDPHNNKYNSIQGRESLVQLSGLINKNFCNFIVKENSTYIKLFPDSNNNSIAPNYFCILKMGCQGLEVQLLLHFFIPTPEKIRDEFVSSLINKISVLKFQPRGKQARPRHMSSQMTKNMEHVPPQQRSWEQINCCTLLSLDLSNLLALYNPIKVIDTPNKSIRRHKMSLSMHYLLNHCHHEFRIWRINDMFAKNIFETLIKIRLQEGFHIAVSDSTSGFINLIKEIHLANNEGNAYKCFIQYLIYPDNGCRSRKDSDNVLTQDDTQSFQSTNGIRRIFTEIFVENKYGKVINAEPEVVHWEGLSCDLIADTINDLDLKSIETFVTFECFQIYPMTLVKGLVKPNICSVLNKSPRSLLRCPLFISEDHGNFMDINNIFMDLLDNNLKLHGFHHIDITKTESYNFNKLANSYEDYERNDDRLNWNCYYTLKREYLLVVMVPGNFFEYNFIPDTSNNLPLFFYGISLKHLSFLIEDSWTLQLPESKQFLFPLNRDNDLISLTVGRKVSQEHDKANEFAVEIETIMLIMAENVRKLDSIYRLTFVGGVHMNLRENHQLSHGDLTNTFSKYCSNLLSYAVDATKFINTICSHCYNAQKSSPIQQQSNFGSVHKDACEVKPGMHERIVKRIRQMMAKYFKEVPTFPHILIYCPENEGDTVNEYNDNADKMDDYPLGISDDILFCRQKSQDNQCVPMSDIDMMFTDNLSEVKSISSIRLTQCNLCPLFISINYTLKYGDVIRHLKFDNIPTCISDFIDDIKSMVDGDVDFQKLKFQLDMIPITYLDCDLHTLLAATKNDDQSITAEVNSGSKRYPAEVAQKYLTSVQTQLLEKCRTELLWTLEDEVVNCLKYCSPVDGVTIGIVKKHIIATSVMKLQKNFVNEIQRANFELDFVFSSEKSKLPFQIRFEKIIFGKYSQYRIDKIDGIYCVFQKRKSSFDPSSIICAMFPDQTYEEMEDIFIQNRLRVDSLCLTSLQTASDNLKGDYLRRCSSEGKLNDLKFVRKMCDSKRESLTLFDKVDNPATVDQTNKTEVTGEVRQVAIPTVAANISQPPLYSLRQYRSPMTSNYQQSSNQTPKRHRSGEASSVMYTGNYRSDTPMPFNDLVSTATSSKGYEGDSSRVSDGEDYDRFSNCPADTKVYSAIQDNVSPFWLLLETVDGCKQIVMYFHHTDNCSGSVDHHCDHCDSIGYVWDKIRACVHEVNQCLLLEQLAQTKICRDILVCDCTQDTGRIRQMYDHDNDDDNVDNCKKFERDTFACPLILKITFKLHPRLKGSAEKNSKVIGALRMSLQNIAISNRKNMLIFIDDNTNGIFYSLLNEISKELNNFELDQLYENSVIISEPNNQEPDPVCTDLHDAEKNADTTDTLSIKSAPTLNDLRSNSKYFPILKSKTMDLLELSVHGVDKLSDGTVKSIIANIGSKLDGIVLKSLSDVICRSSIIWLTKEDLDFLLSIDYNNKPQKPKSFFWSLPKLAVDNSLAFCYYLKQNLQSMFISPKICDTSLNDRFNFNDDMVGEVYLYNQPSAQGVAHDAIVLLTVQMFSTESFTSWKITDYSLPEFQEDDDFELSTLIRDSKLVEMDSRDTITDAECCLKFSLWLRGHVAIEVIKKKIFHLIQYAISDLILEFVVIPRPISTIDCHLLSQIKVNKSDVESLLTALESGENGILQPIYADDVFKWFPELAKSENPLIKHRITDMFSDFNVEYLINDLVDGIADSINFNVFYRQNNCWLPWNTKQPKSGKDYPGLKRSFILIGRIEELWKKFVTKRLLADKDNNDMNLSISQSSQISNVSVSTCSMKFRVLLKHLPFENNCLNSSMNSSTSTLNSSTIHAQNLPEFCHVQVQSAVVIPRQMLCIIKIDGCQINTISYNLAKDTIDNLNTLVDNIVKNHKSRFQMLNSFIYQKLGLFHESASKSCLPALNINTVKALAQLGKAKNLNLNFNDNSRDRRPSGSPRSFSPSRRVSNASTLSNQSKSTSKNQPPKKVQMHININKIYQDPYTIYPISDMVKSESVNDIIYQHAWQFLNTYNLEMKRRIVDKKIRQCISFFLPKHLFNLSENCDTLTPLEQLDVFSCMKRACRVFHSVVCPILFIPSVRKSLLKVFVKPPVTESEADNEESSSIEEWLNVVSIKLLGYYAEYVQKEHNFQFVNPPRPNVSQNPCSHALFQKSINNSGIYLMEVFILKGCLCVRLSAFEFRRFNGWITGVTSFFNQFPQPIQHPQKTFVKDACRLCDLTHLFSFIYDFYVGMVVKSITSQEENKKYFNVVSFLRDLVRMHSYPPMYACNHIYWMPFPVANDLIKPSGLFDFLVRHYEDYEFLLSQNISDPFNIDTSQLFLYTINDEPFQPQTLMEIKRTISPSSSPLNIAPSPHNIDDRHSDTGLQYDFTSIFCLTKSANQIESAFDLFIVTFNKSNSFPHQNLYQIPKPDPSVMQHHGDNVFYPAKYLSILPHKSSSPDNMLHLQYCPVSANSIDTDQFPHSLSWITFDNRTVLPLQVPLFLTLRSRIESYVTKTNQKLTQAVIDCHKDSLWHRMYQKPDSNDSSKLALKFKEFQDLINSGDIVDILELDPRLVDSMKIAASYLRELDKSMCLLSDDCCTLLYENASPINQSTDDNLSTHLVLMSKNTNDGFLLLSKTHFHYSEDSCVELKAVFRSQDCRNRMTPKHRYFSSTLRDVTVMLAETAAFCIWRKLASKS